ncbi:type II secretion system protein GspL [Sphingomonas xinjiangensis]|uniref:General secretion pathway protein L n=1 Tax=Sphingomonas xinjiangensis TaxID=643568 RepID=A0A840YQP2_9SPHN|nr:general secretion pathway protein L [Sphingomonas xinjiangensis]
MTQAARPIGAPDQTDAPAAGVWTLAGGRLIIAEPGGPATVLVSTEQVRLLAVDLPLSTRAKRLEALPFAVEEQLAEPAESVHLALGAEIAPKRYLVGVVRHDLMAAWVEAAEDAGLGHAAMVPDALALPRPGEGQWAVDLGAERAVVRSGDGSGFACPAPVLRAAWEAAGRPPVTAYGAPMPEDMAQADAGLASEPLATRLLQPALDLRQGLYARRRASLPNVWRRTGWIVALGAAAHVVIAAADTLMLQTIAGRRADETRAAAALAAPGVNLSGDFAASVADMLPSGAEAAPDLFLPLLSRVSGALGPIASSLTVRTVGFQANTLTMDVERGEAGLVGRIDAALRAARVPAQVTQSPDGAIRITARPA